METMSMKESRVITSKDLDNYCTVCKRLFKDLLTHNAKKHKRTNYKCPFCSKQSQSSSDLMRHIKIFHALQIGLISTTTPPIGLPREIHGRKLRTLLEEFVIVKEEDYYIDQNNFVICYDKEKKIANYTFESKTCSALGSSPDPEWRSYEPFEPLGINQMTYKQISSLDHAYDAGHLAPCMFNAGNQDNVKETCIYPNLIPMHRTLNTGMWSSCEMLPGQHVRIGSVWERVHILSGTILDERKRKRATSGLHYYIPAEVFKILFLEARDETPAMLCFILPNEDIYGNIYQYLTDLDEISRKTRIQFTDKARNIPQTKDIQRPTFRCGRCNLTFISMNEYREHEKIHSGKFGCTTCSKEFATLAELLSHRSKLHPLITCPKCPKTFDVKSRLKSHMAVHSNIRKYKCSWVGCKKAFKKKSELTKHYCTHLNVNRYKCAYCNFASGNQVVLNKHIRQEHNRFPPSLRSSLHMTGFKQRATAATNAKGLKIKNESRNNHDVQFNLRCMRCSTTFLNAEEYKKHEKLHDSKFGCIKCPEEFCTRIELDNHLLLKHPKISCPHCPKTFTLQCYLKRHLRVHSDEKNYKCNWEGCTKWFKTKSDMQKHYRRHSSGRSFPCLVCTYASADQSTLKRHIRTQHPSALMKIIEKAQAGSSSVPQSSEFTSEPKEATEHKFFCGRCWKRFPTIQQLETHKSEKHPTFVCSQCPKTFEFKNALDRHSLVHTEERRFACDFPGCSRRYKRAEHLKRHITSHSDNKPGGYTLSSHAAKAKTGSSSIPQLPESSTCETKKIVENGFFCRKCWEKLPTIEQLETHKSEKHPAFVCGHCPKTFDIKSELERHSLVHTKERPFACDFPGCSRHQAKAAANAQNAAAWQAAQQASATLAAQASQAAQQAQAIVAAKQAQAAQITQAAQSAQAAAQSEASLAAQVAQATQAVESTKVQAIQQAQALASLADAARNHAAQASSALHSVQAVQAAQAQMAYQAQQNAQALAGKQQAALADLAAAQNAANKAASAASAAQSNIRGYGHGHH